MMIAVIITCHNRRGKTLACLAALFKSHLPEGCSFEVFLVDDGSTDGTEHAVRECYPQVNTIKGNGSLYWNGGMRVAFAAAMEKPFNYYLWLNDDTLLYQNALEILITTTRSLQAKHRKNSIVVGSTQDARDGRLTYGGVIRSHKYKALAFTLISPRVVPVECETMNGNCVFVPHSVAQVVGNLEPRFAHAMGDIDYGLRARKSGFKLWVAPGFIGTCDRNDIAGTFNDRKLPLRTRWKMIMQPKGLPPSSWLLFTFRHAGPLWPIFFLWPYLRILY